MTTASNPPGRPRLSAAMIVRDEEDVLAATIESLRTIADEIVILDTGSTDRTPEIAEQMGAVVSRLPWADDFSLARNRLLERVTGDWVLWLDAGERLEAGSAAELRNFVDQEADPEKVYSLMVEIPPADPSASAEQMAQPRLMPMHPVLCFTGRVCESLRPSMAAIGLQVQLAPGRIVRHPRQHDPEIKARKAQRNLKLIALETSPDGAAPSRLLIAAGEAYSDLNDRAAASNAFLQATKTAQRGSTEMLEGYYGLLAALDGDPAQSDRQLAVCLEALEIFPLDVQLLCAMGSYLQAQNRVDLAGRAFETAVRFGQLDLETWHLREIVEMAAICLSLTLQLQGKDDEARRVLEEASDRHQGSFRIRRHLIGLHVKHGRDGEAIEVAGAIPMDPQRREAWRDAIRGAAKAAAQDWGPALGYLQSAYVAGCQDPFCLRWLAVTLLSNGQTTAAEPVLHEWLRLEPNNIEVQTYLEALRQQAKAEDAPAEPSQPCHIRIEPAAGVQGHASIQAPGVGQPSPVDPIVDCTG